LTRAGFQTFTVKASRAGSAEFGRTLGDPNGVNYFSVD